MERDWIKVEEWEKDVSRIGRTGNTRNIENLYINGSPVVYDLAILFSIHCLLLLSKSRMMYFHRARPFPQEVNVVLEALCLPKLIVGVNTLPPYHSHICFSFLP